ncbi:SRPBCC family protein [Gemmatimonadota bacterium]
MRLGAKIFGTLGGLLILYLLAGSLLPGTWEAEFESAFPHPPSVVFPYLNQIDRWSDWMPMPPSGSQLFGPPGGVGAGLRWDDPQYGKGEVRILGSLPDSQVVYQVEVEGGALRFRGTLTLVARQDGTLVRWREEGDFGWSPLMGYAARGMSASQTEAMEASLQKLGEVLVEEPAGGL